ncbi:hypothetical protein [Pseudomonas sp. WHRI 8519]|uniref:hypothetical protein n=1 Tax=Pseudomonas sp. WHRI 8519 TaxID=3162567 RepID=UPI0032F08E68
MSIISLQELPEHNTSHSGENSYFANAQEIFKENEMLRSSLFQLQEQFENSISVHPSKKNQDLAMLDCSHSESLSHEQIIIDQLLHAQEQIEAYHNFCGELIAALARTEGLLDRARDLMQVNHDGQRP